MELEQLQLIGDRQAVTKMDIEGMWTGSYWKVIWNKMARKEWRQEMATQK